MINVSKINSSANYTGTSSAKQLYQSAIIIAAVVLAAYSSVVLNNFGILDDYIFLDSAIKGENSTLSLLVGAGRPLNAVLLYKGFAWAGSISGLSILRSVTLLGVWLLGLSLYSFCKRNGVTNLPSLVIACATLLLPSFHVYASWAQHFTTPFAGILALLSASILTPKPSASLRISHSRLLLAFTFLLTAILIYQPLAMLFCTGILISFLSKPEEIKDWTFRRNVQILALFSSAMLAGLVIFKLGQHFYPSNAARYGLVKDIPGKLIWFFSEPLANALSLYSVPKKTTTLFFSLLYLLVSFVFFTKRYGRHISIAAFLGSAFYLAASYAPSLATAENWASYRSIGALSASVVAIFVLIAREPLNFFSGKYSNFALYGRFDIFAPTFLIACLFLTVLKVQGIVSNSFVLPNVFELNNLSSFLKHAHIEESEHVSVLVKPASWEDSSARPMAYDEFGMPSSIRDYYALAIVDLTLRNINRLQNAKVSVLSTQGVVSSTDAAQHKKELIVDFARLTASQRFKND